MIEDMRSNWKRRAQILIATVAILASACSSVLPWSKEKVGAEVNLAFVLENNLVRLQTLRIDDRPGSFLLGSAAPQTVLDPSFPTTGTPALQVSKARTFRLSPAILDLRGVADGIIGADAWDRRAITIDYHKGLVTWQREGIYPYGMTLFNFQAEPTIVVSVDGVDVTAIVDTTSPDTLTLPSPDTHRTSANILIAGTDFGSVDIGHADVSQARIGNRLLARFLVTIDYGKRVVGLWPDTRTLIDASLPAPGRT